MRVLLAFDKFKGALSAAAAGLVADRALRTLHPDWEIDHCPLADGGDGFSEILTHEARGQWFSWASTDPLGRPVLAGFGLVPWGNIPAPARQQLLRDFGRPEPRPDDRIAVIEMAAASGLGLLATEERNPWRATTEGTGALMRQAASLGAVGILLGAGGSATHDLGCGILSALGLEFRDGAGQRVQPPVPACWAEIEKIVGAVFESLPPIWLACDVTTPLLGLEGAAWVYGPQKGLRDGDWGELEHASTRMAALLCRHFQQPIALVTNPGTGAAGGLTFGLQAGVGARLLPGFELVTEWLDLEARIRAADVVLTGEGRYDDSSCLGKGAGALAKRAADLGKPVHLFAGEVVRETLAPPGVALEAITPPGLPLSRALQTSAEHLGAAVSRVFRFESATAKQRADS